MTIPNANLYRIERSKEMNRAIQRAKEVHPKATRISRSAVKVTTRTSVHVVRFTEPVPGLLLAGCDCKSKVLCRCIAASVVVPGTIVTDRPAPKIGPIMFHGVAPRPTPAPAPVYRRPSNGYGEMVGGFQI